MHKPLFWLTILIFISPFYWLPNLSPQFLKLIKNIIFILFVTSVIWHFLIKKRFVLFLPKDMGILIFIYPLALLPGAIFSKSFLFSGIQYLKYLLPILFFIFLYNILENENSIRFVVKAVMWPIIIQATYSTLIIIGLIKGFLPPSDTGGLLSGGQFVNIYKVGFTNSPTNFGPLTAFTTLLIFGFLGENCRYKNSFLKNVLILLILLVLITALIETGNRASLLATIIGIIIFTRNLFPLLFPVFISSLVLFSLFIFPYILMFLKYHIFVKQGLLAGFEHLVTYIIGLEMAKYNPLTGVGFGRSFTESFNYIPSYILKSWSLPRNMQIHNVPILFLAEGGIFAGVIVLIFIFFIISRFKIFRQLKFTKLNILALSLYTAIIVFAIESLFEPWPIWGNFYSNILWWVCFASLLVLPKMAVRENF